MSSQLNYSNEPIAIVGSACRFAGEVSSPSKLWYLLKTPRDVLSEIPLSRFNAAKFHHPDNLHHGTSNVRHAYLLSEDHRLFDAQFFGVKPVEASAIDPQQRLLLETTYEALESAGIPLGKIQGSDAGVFVGLMNEDYSTIVGRDLDNVPTYFASGTARSIMANRLSYFFDIHGPSMVIDTACSSSLVALHQAALSLRGKESGVSIVAGANLLLGPEYFIAEAKLKMLSPTGRSRMWDKDADGYARADGFGVLILKTLSKAIADGDSIECIVRETGINQDGRTKGITMPNPKAQADLIKATYAKAGLDLSKSSDRPQYFEAHGTGTPAGDPMEAEAISTTFFGSTSGFTRNPGEPPLYVGSIKTILGHTEGTAGIAGLMKASLAMQNGVIPPNMLLNELNPRVKPFYTDLKIARTALEWPEVSETSPRRASVNSFGFGGANAHAILESYTPSSSVGACEGNEDATLLMPFNFSAATEKSLIGNLHAFAEYAKANPLISMRDLAWTLNTRRTSLPTRFSISALSIKDLVTRIESVSDTSNGIVTSNTSARSQSEAPRLLGVFTGQGAQWATMGAHLINGSRLVSESLGKLQEALKSLPDPHKPSWSLTEELLKGPDTSRIGQAAFSQPLCTAVQIVLVQLLRAANIKLTAVVGHSSGEIGAAYAAGYVSAQDAIRIAYYRGFFLELSNATQGGMMAAEMNHEDARELCQLPSLQGRLQIAAMNSPTSVTLSGDMDAVLEAKDILEDENKFARVLKVDKAYHSHHMLPCGGPYVDALRSCGIKVLPYSYRVGYPTWISSVTGEDIESSDLTGLGGQYWADNQANTVLFTQALERAVNSYSPFDMGIEVGPHPALKKPALDTISKALGSHIPYTGLLSRGKNDAEAFATGLGSLWLSLGEGVVDFDAFDKATHGSARAPKVLKGLPTYSWMHDRIYWHETRYGKAWRVNGEASHQLLGTACPEEADGEIRFRNFLNPRDIPWLVDHKVQDQIVFPAAGYISSVIEALARLHPIQSIKLIQFSDLIIGQALFVPEDGGIESMLSIKEARVDSSQRDFVFSYYSDSNRDSNGMIENASGTVRLVFGTPSHDALPSPYSSTGEFVEFEPERFYTAARDFGFGYEGAFQGMIRTTRKIGEGAGILAVPKRSNNPESDIILHPGLLDSAVQSILVSFCYPGDGRMRDTHLPTRVDRISINPLFWLEATRLPNAKLPFYSTITSEGPGDFTGDVEVSSSDGKTMLIQLQGLYEKVLTPQTTETDVKIFSETTWAPELPIATTINWEDSKFATELALSFSLERVAYFYLRKLSKDFPGIERNNLQPQFIKLLEYADYATSRVGAGENQWAHAEWNEDSEKDISAVINSYNQNVDMRLIKAVGENLPLAMKQKADILEVMARNDMLNSFYDEALGMHIYAESLADIARQLSHRFPHMNILELGASKGGATKYVLKGLDNTFSSYTYSDSSELLFSEATERFQQYKASMLFKALDIDRPVAGQSFNEGSYDLVIASLALHGTRNLEKTMSHVRKLLRPGGYLIMLEFTDNEPLRFGLIFGSLPGWWAGYDEGRKLSPCISSKAWEGLAIKTGFSGMDGITPHSTSHPIPLSTMVFQATNNQVNFLRQPLAPNAASLALKGLTVVGGQSVPEKLRRLLQRHYKSVQWLDSMADLLSNNLPFLGTVVSFADLTEESVLRNVTERSLEGIKSMFTQSKTTLWVTCGARADNPLKNMFLGFQRTVALELSVRTHFLDFDSLEEVNYDVVISKLLALEAYTAWREQGQSADPLWYSEPNMLVRGGKVHVPRLKSSKHRNDRYNSTKRAVTRRVATTDTRLSIIPHMGKLHVEEQALAFDNDTPKVQLTYSILRAIRVAKKSKAYVSYGEMSGTGERVIVLSDKLESHLQVPSLWTVPVPRSIDSPEKALTAVYMQLLAQSILEVTVKGAALVVFNADRRLGNTLAELAAEKGVVVCLLTSRLKKLHKPWAYVHEQTAVRSIKRVLPANASVFVSFGEQSDVSRAIQRCLPLMCLSLTPIDLVSDDAQLDLSPAGVRAASDCLQAAWLRSATGDIINSDSISLPTIDLNEISRAKSFLPPTQALLSWNAGSSIDIHVRPASEIVRFKADKTYWLVGLTGGLGLSLSQWMAGRGAKFIVLSSRNPKIETTWLQMMADRGCTVKVIANDITDKKSVQRVYREITDDMPPIGGVAQGAMVLHDTLLPDLTLDRVEKVLKPKVDGTFYLDELFPEDTLDFFLGFSSVAYTNGNAGQSCYGAANAFLAAFAANRRKRGLAGSVINIGVIVGNGYVSREMTPAKQLALWKAGLSFMSEQDFHETFAEGVLSGHSKSQDSLELTTGLRLDDDNDDESKNWSNNPIFQHLITRSSSPTSSDGKTKAVAIRTQLRGASSKEGIFEIIKEGFLVKLQSSLQADLDKPLEAIGPDDLGIDSLLAVDFQSWFRKELGVDIPVLKILNAASIYDLLCSAQKLLDAETVPKGNTTDSTTIETTSVAEDTPVAIEKDPWPKGVTPIVQIAPVSPSSSATVISGPHTPNESLASSLFPKSADQAANCLAVEELSPELPKSDECLFDDKQNFERSVPMSFAQSRLWFLKHFLESQSALNVTSLITVEGYLDAARLERAVIAVGQRHEGIRTAFYVDDATQEPMQGVLAEPVLRLEYEKVSSEEEVQTHVQIMRKHNFNITIGETVRLKLLSLSDNTHFMIFSYHHITLDGIGLKLFFDDVESAYNGVLASMVDNNIVQYPDFSMRQRKQYTDGSWSDYLSYWQANFADVPPTLPLFGLAHRVARPEKLGYDSVSSKARIDDNLKGKIRQCCRQLRITPFHFYLAVFRILIFRHTNNTANNFCIGVADGNRKDVDTLRSLGLFLNLVPLRFNQHPKQTFAHTVKDSKVTSDESFSNSRVPFDILLNELHVGRDLSHSPLFQAFFNYRQNIQEARDWCGCKTSGNLVQSGQNAYDISLDITDSAVQENQFVLSVNTDLYTQSGADILMNSYIYLLKQFVSNPSMQISKPALYPEQDVQAAIKLGRGPEYTSEWPSTVVDRIDYVIHSYADRCALRDTLQHSMTYKQMSSRIDQLTTELMGLSILAGDVVGIYQQPGVDWICSLLAILRSGAACVPLDLQVGPGRLQLMVEDCRPKVIMVDSETRTQVDFLGTTGANLVNVSDISDHRVVRRIPSRAQPSGAAIIAYTSGSTGVPKGIVLSHQGYRNLFEFTPPRWAIRGGNEVVLQQSSYAFDISILQAFTCLGWGGTLVIVDASKRHDPAAICDLIVTEGVTFTLATPTEYLAWIRVADREALRQSGWRGAMCGGEAMTKSLIRAFKSLNKPDLNLINAYGPAEATIAVADSIVPYLDADGTEFTLSVLPNCTVRIVDDDLNPVPAGVTGQVVVGGLGIASGYLNRDELTSRAFIRDTTASPFLKEAKSTTVHLTGDRGRLDANGRLTLHGRIEGSTQIKIGGARVDLEDVENTITDAMGQHIDQVAVSPRIDASGNVGSLVAFIVLSTSKPPADRAAFVAGLPHALPLPNYMRPSHAVALETIPLTNSAKIDRSALAVMALETINVAPPVGISETSELSNIERQLQALWQEALPVRSTHTHMIGQQTDFFHVGGSSLSLMNLQRLIKDRFRATVPIVKLFQASSLAQMAALLQDPQGASQGTSQGNPKGWEGETTIPTEIAKLAAESIPERRAGPKASDMAVVLTGATGFLGREIVRQLIANDRVSKVHCLAVRQASQHLLPPSPKIVVHTGDLAAPRLGLSPSEAQAVFNEADAIIHAGADVSFLKTYGSLRAPNVGSTRELVRLALPRRVPFHFVSSATVARLSGREALGPESVASWPPPRDGEAGSEFVDGYTTAKWVNEVYLERVARELALDVVVHRPTSIVPDGDEAQTTKPKDLLGNLMFYMRKTRSVPDSSNMRGAMDFVRVSTVAARLIERVVASITRTGVAARDGGGIEYMYESSEKVVDVKEVKSFLEAELGNGEEFRVLPRMEWINVAERAGMDHLLSAYVRQSIDGPVLFPRVLES